MAKTTLTRSRAPFAFVELPPARTAQKPRKTGFTMVAVFG